jgi:hypothetical protein
MKKNILFTLVLIICILSVFNKNLLAGVSPSNYDLKNFSRDAKIMYKMIHRTNFLESPLSEYNHVYLVTKDNGHKTSKEMQTAYYNVLMSMLRGEYDTSSKVIDDQFKFLISEIVPAGSLWVALYDNIYQDNNVKKAIQELSILYTINANTNDNNLKIAIEYILSHEYIDNVNTLRDAVISELEDVLKTELFELDKALVKDTFGNEMADALGNIFGIYDKVETIFNLITRFNNDKKSAADRIIALHEIRTSLLNEYSQVIRTGRTIGYFSEAELLYAKKLYGLIYYCLSEQGGWAFHAMGNDFWGNSNYYKDDKRASEYEEYRHLNSPAWYPYSYSSKLSDEEVAEAIANADKIEDILEISEPIIEVEKSADAFKPVAEIEIYHKYFIITIPANYTLECYFRML